MATEGSSGLMCDMRDSLCEACLPKSLRGRNRPFHPGGVCTKVGVRRLPVIRRLKKRDPLIPVVAREAANDAAVALAKL